MIETLTIKNFQSHKDTTINFCTGFNVIEGASDAGKSSILRAIKWVIFNRPNGTDFIREGETYCSVTIELLSGHVIERMRSKSKNIYKLNGETLSAIGSDVPEPVQKILNIQPYNFQGQFDSPFLLSSSPGETAKELNKAVNLNAISTGMRNALKKSREDESKVGNHNEELENLKKAVKKYENLDEIGDRIILANDLDESIRVLKDKFETFDRIYTKYKRLCDEILPIIQTIKSCDKEMEELDCSFKEYEERKGNALQYNTWIQKYNRICDNIFEVPGIDFSPLEQSSDEIKKQRNILISLESRFHVFKREFETLKNKQEALQSKINELKEYSNEVCPLCNGSGKVEI